MSSNLMKTAVWAMTALAVLQGCTQPGDGKVYAKGNTTKKVVVSAVTVEERTFEERVIAQGNVLAKNTAMVAPEIGGVITDMFVQEGDAVKAKETPLFQIDKITVTQAYEIALQDSKLAACGLKDAEAQLVAAQAQHDKAKLDYERFMRLREQQAITPDAMEQMEAGYTVAKAQLERASAGVTLRAEQAKQAEAALVIAKKHLDDSLVFSPIDGWISLRLKKQGEFIGAGNPVVKVTNTQLLEVSAFLPGEYYPRVKTGETRMRIHVSGIDLGALPVSFKSPEIQDQLRTFEVKCLVEAPPEGVVPGAIANIEAVLQTTTGPGVPSEAIQIRNGKPVVFLVENGAAKAVEIEKGLVVDGFTEVTNDSVPAGASVITLGSTLVNDGTLVDMQQEDK